jgi:hypothetical protein
MFQAADEMEDFGAFTTYREIAHHPVNSVSRVQARPAVTTVGSESDLSP